MSDLSREELLAVFDYEMKIRDARIDQIVTEIEKRKANGEQIKERLLAGEISTPAELKSMLEEIQNDITRCRQLEEEVVAIKAEAYADLLEIFRHD